MSLFYFDVRKGERLIPDDGDGLELPDLAAVEREATEAATEIARDFLWKAKAGHITVAVRNEQGDQVMTVTVSVLIDREPGTMATHVEAGASSTA